MNCIFSLRKLPMYRFHGKEMFVINTEISNYQQRRSISKSNAFEVEKKFHFDPKKVILLEHNQGPKQFDSVRFLGEKSFVDVYYDQCVSTSHTNVSIYPLSSQDIWLRKRENHWECKVPLSMTSKMDSYHEMTDFNEIVSSLSPVISGSLHHTPAISKGENNIHIASEEEFEKWLEHHHIVRFGRIVTTRRKYQINGEFTVDLDSTDFGHHVGEVEIMVGEVSKIEIAEKSILDLCNQHSWFFDIERLSMGKLLMFIKTFNPQQWQSLVRSGLIQKKGIKDQP